MINARTSLASLAGMAALAMSGLGAIGQSALDIVTAKPKAQSNQDAQKGTASKTVQANKSIAGIRTGEGYVYGDRRPGGPGWSNRQVQRMARKKRAVKANRKNHR